MKEALLQQYATVRAKQEALETEEKILKVQIIDAFRNEPKTKIEKDYGVFTYSSRKNWSYSSKIEKMEEDIKIKKVEEIERGIAKIKSETEVLSFKVK